MTLLIALFILGAVQGLTEFLPVSSTAHLVFLQSVFNFPGNRLYFDVSLHLATLFAIVVYFRKQLLEYTRNVQVLKLLVVANIPTAIIGLGLKDTVEVLTFKPKIVALFLLITAGVTFVIDSMKRGDIRVEGMGIKEALTAGVFQGFSVIPGISRSGSTILGLLIHKVDPEEAAAFSFVMSIPAILGATLIEIKDYGLEFEPAFLVGMISAFVFGILALHFFVDFLKKKKFKLFSIYLVFVSLLVLLL